MTGTRKPNVRETATAHLAIQDPGIDRTAKLVTGAMLLIAFLGMVLLIARSPQHPIFDEVYFANYLTLLHRFGYTPAFLNSLNAAPGPLCAVVQTIFSPLTHLQPVAMRFVNLFLLAITASVLAHRLRLMGESVWVAASMVLAVPMVWVVGGMALSEISAMLFVALSLVLLLHGLDGLESHRSSVPSFLVAGACLGVAVWGRQPYLLLAAVPVLLALTDRRLWASAAAFVLAVLTFAVPLFVVWKGVVAPSQHLQPGFSIEHGLLSLGYTGFCFLLLGARGRWFSLKLALGLVLLTVLVNSLLGDFTLAPFRSLIERNLSPEGVLLYGKLFGSFFLSFGVLSLGVLLKMIWESRSDLRSLSVNAGLLCVASAPLLDTHLYSSRYTAMTLPYLMLATHAWRQWKWSTTVLALLGAGMGFLSLLEYFRYAH